MKTNDKKWYVVYTLSRHEKKIEKMLNLAGIESFLPMHTVVRQWSDRKRKVTIPLFPNYLFVHVSNQAFWQVLSINGVIRFVSTERVPVPVPDQIIRSIRKVLSGNIEISGPKIEKGELVKVISGPFIGAEGHFIRHGKRNMLVIEIDLIRRSVMLEIEPGHIERLGVTSSV